MVTEKQISVRNMSEYWPNILQKQELLKYWVLPKSNFWVYIFDNIFFNFRVVAAGFQDDVNRPLILENFRGFNGKTRAIETFTLFHGAIIQNRDDFIGL